MGYVGGLGGEVGGLSVAPTLSPIIVIIAHLSFITAYFGITARFINSTLECRACKRVAALTNRKGKKLVTITRGYNHSHVISSYCGHCTRKNRTYQLENHLCEERKLRTC